MVGSRNAVLGGCWMWCGVVTKKRKIPSSCVRFGSLGQSKVSSRLRLVVIGVTGDEVVAAGKIARRDVTKTMTKEGARKGWVAVVGDMLTVLTVRLLTVTDDCSFLAGTCFRRERRGRGAARQRFSSDSPRTGWTYTSRTCVPVVCSCLVICRRQHSRVWGGNCYKSRQGGTTWTRVGGR